MAFTDPTENSVVKQLNDARKIRQLESSGVKHIYDYEAWQPWTGNNYIKSYYDVLLSDGTIILHLWPNAGNLNRGRYHFTKADNIQVRLSQTSPL